MKNEEVQKTNKHYPYLAVFMLYDTQTFFVIRFDSFYLI